MNKKVLILLTVVFFTILTFALVKLNSISDNKLYTVDKNSSYKSGTNGNSNIDGGIENKFYDVSAYESKLAEAASKNTVDKNAILLTVSKDKTHIFYMVPTFRVDKPDTKVIKGRTNLYMDLVDWDLKTGDRYSLSLVPFITSVNRNPNETLAAFRGESYLLHYSFIDALRERNIITDKPIESASWSPDGTKVYYEDASMPYCGSEQIADNNISEPYKDIDGTHNSRDVILKAKINSNAYFAIVQSINSANSLLSSCSTVIADSSGNILTELCAGIYKDSFGRAVLVKNLDHTVSYIKDFNLEKQPYKLTDDIVYDSAFIFDGGFYYITEDKESQSNGFILHRLDTNKKELQTFKISGSRLFLSPDGKKGFVNGEKLEAVDFMKGTVTPTIAPGSEDELIKVLNLALKDVKASVLSTIPLNPEYFTEQAYSNVTKLIDNAFKGIPSSYEALLKSLKPEEQAVMLSENKINDSTAEVKLKLSASVYWLKELSSIYDIKLIKENGQWKITDVLNSK